jgi:hypothetical protein
VPLTGVLDAVMGLHDGDLAGKVMIVPGSERSERPISGGAK